MQYNIIKICFKLCTAGGKEWHKRGRRQTQEGDGRREKVVVTERREGAEMQRGARERSETVNDDKL